MRFRLLVIGASFLVAPLYAGVSNPRILLLDAAVVGSEIITVGERGGIFRSSDNARTWLPAASGPTATLTGVAFSSDGKRGWAVGHDASILTSIDAGRSWQLQWKGENLADSFLDVLALTAEHVLAVGAYGLFLHSTDGGKTWTRRKLSEDDYHFNRLSRGPTGTLYLAGEHGTLFRSTDEGTTWVSIPAAYEGSFYGILPLDKRTLIAHGLRGHVFRSIDDGATWTPLSSTEPVLLAASLKLKSNFFVLGGHARVFLISRDYGKSLKKWETTLTTAVAELVEAPDGSIVAFGEAGATLLEAPR